ncbi:MAG: hypothetical protein IT423_01650 [Pirellulaceae bacterium]|nr:hypothetical protein [Pirellulaceae bacterium]
MDCGLRSSIRNVNPRWACLVQWVCLALWAWLTLATSSLHAQTATKNAASADSQVKLDATGLSLAARDVAFFSTSLNMRKGLLEDVESGWIAEIRQVPYIQEVEQFLRTKWENPEPETEQVKNFLTSPIARDLMLLASDMTAHECFIIGEKSWCDFLKAFAKFQYELAASGQDPESMRDYFLDMTKEDFDAIPVPTTIMGFQLSEDENARTQLDALEGILQLGMSAIDQLKPLAKNLRRKDLANGQTLSMTFSAEDIPWENIPIPDADAQDVVDHLAELLVGRKVVLTLGVVNDRFMMSISESADTLANLGRNGNLLATDALKQLANNQPADLRSVNYTSGEFRKASWDSNFDHYFERIALQITGPLSLQFESDEFDKWQEKLTEDCQWLDEKLVEMMPKYSSALAYGFHTAEGLETLAYDWTPSWLLENAKPLAVAKHGGTAPLILIASRQKWLNGIGEIVDAVMEEIPEHAEMLQEAGLIQADDVEKFEEMSEKVMPIIEDMIAAVRDHLIPGLDGNESLVAITAQTLATQLSEDAPTPPAPLPLPEMAVVMKIKNKDLFLTGCDQFIRSINAMISLMREENPGQIPPEVQVPEPESESLAEGGTRYSFPMGAPAPWDQFELQMAISNDVAVLGYSSRQVRDLYQSRPLAARPGWYSETEPLAQVGFIDIAGIFRAVKPWVHYALTNVNEDLDQPLGPSENDIPVPTGTDVLLMWDCFKKLGKCAGTTVVDKNDVTVSHWIWVGE